jgi:molybdopterin/thiamine biosynthesis adenylyltransferase
MSDGDEEPAGPADRYARQVSFPPLGAEGQARLRAARVLVVGCGALGSQAAAHLTGAGVGLLRLVDRDIVELSNLHRQPAFSEADARDGAPKAMALAASLRRLNSEVKLEARAVDFSFTNAETLAEGIDLILDGSDNVPTRFLLNDLSLARRIPWVYGGVVGETGQAQLFLPGAGPCLRCLIPELPPPGELETCHTAGVLGPAAGVIASFQAAMAIRCLGGGPAEAASLNGRLLRVKAWSLEARVSAVSTAPLCAACGRGELEFLRGRLAEAATVLCGRGAVQVRPARPQANLDLPALALKLRPLGQVEEKRFLLRFRAEGVDLTVFPDGRAILAGTTDPARAQAVYARYVGQ